MTPYEGAIDASQGMEGVRKKLTEQAERFAEARTKLAEARGRGEAADGKVVVEVARGGALQSLKIDPRAMRLGSEALAEAILEAAGKAGQDITDQTNELMKPAFGDPEKLAEQWGAGKPDGPVSPNEAMSRAMGLFEDIFKRYS
ncbi:YbaB/EbfC family nucleoid-associated protein [Actinoallomurus purpureus]|uniref:YbaB/EbfC family nucleoid-associated protein n=1 Tax=Actinoallomurus purpureus TaxID=478114 RepID=UPI0020931173|nr:YbaB/EbfC family nucleoid-associated protein [Actinoallomurus purpureus]MCO6011611.1 YbaB/EbfC family nucleoid-associated protein [Actinoallomurus purpureus]